MGRKTMALLFAPRSARARQNYVRVFYGQSSDDEGRERDFCVLRCAGRARRRRLCKRDFWDGRDMREG